MTAGMRNMRYQILHGQNPKDPGITRNIGLMFHIQDSAPLPIHSQEMSVTGITAL